MRSVEKTTCRMSVGCWDLGLAGIIETSRCCKICHSADEYALARSMGPCHAILPDGKEAHVCCAAKSQLLSENGS